jgi:hypothetical protein
MVVMQLHVADPFSHYHSRNCLVEHRQPGQHLVFISKAVDVATAAAPEQVTLRHTAHRIMWHTHVWIAWRQVAQTQCKKVWVGSLCSTRRSVPCRPHTNKAYVHCF